LHTLGILAAQVADQAGVLAHRRRHHFRRIGVAKIDDQRLAAEILEADGIAVAAEEAGLWHDPLGGLVLVVKPALVDTAGQQAECRKQVEEIASFHAASLCSSLS
jgi:hypothetical protein